MPNLVAGSDVVAESDVMAVLRFSTADEHQRVEDLMPFFRREFLLEDYIQTLGAFLGFFEPVERALSSAADGRSLGIDVQSRSRAHLLQDDLNALGVSASEVARFPRCSALPFTGSPASALGCLYVLEGSTLGGQVIGKELARRFGIGQSTGASFFLSHGPRVGDMWREFGSAVRAQVRLPISRQQAVDAAQQTFASLEDWMRKVAIHA